MWLHLDVLLKKSGLFTVFTNKQELIEPAYPDDCVLQNKKYLEHILLAQPVCKVISLKYRMRSQAGHSHG